mmetsp:Transcript_16882/g.30579  ORF Transcript_16882/g.30579 Transcript_16882/m.30579 type:complete len:295 (-) Transcript_16882:35-919(-)
MAGLGDCNPCLLCCMSCQTKHLWLGCVQLSLQPFLLRLLFNGWNYFYLLLPKLVDELPQCTHCTSIGVRSSVGIPPHSRARWEASTLDYHNSALQRRGCVTCAKSSTSISVGHGVETSIMSQNQFILVATRHWMQPLLQTSELVEQSRTVNSTWWAQASFTQVTAVGESAGSICTTCAACYKGLQSLAIATYVKVNNVMSESKTSRPNQGHAKNTAGLRSGKAVLDVMLWFSLICISAETVVSAGCPHGKALLPEPAGQEVHKRHHRHKAHQNETKRKQPGLLPVVGLAAETFA